MSDPKHSMTGERSENSVLFSLSHLQRLGSADRTAELTCAPVHTGPSRDPAGSGLIDIRVMTAAARRRSLSSGDELSVNATPRPLPQLPAAGVLMPVQPGQRPWWLVPSLVLGGALIITVVGLLAALLLREASPAASTPSVSQPARVSTPPAGRPTAVPSVVTADRLAPPPVVTKRVAPPPPDPETSPKAEDRDRRRAEKRRNLRTKQRKTKKKHPKDRPKKVVPRDPDKAAPTPKPRTIADILGDVGKRPTDGRKPKTAKALPRQLGRTDIHSGVRRVVSAALRCGRRFGTSGVVNVRLIVKGATGAVASATPKGKFASTESGRCVARALQRAKFRTFRAARHAFYYTVILR